VFPDSISEGNAMLYNIYSLIPVNKIEAHQGIIQILNINNEGSLMATCSDKGTIVRVFELPSGKLFKTFRRGNKQAEIICLKFSLNSEFISLFSD